MQVEPNFSSALRRGNCFLWYAQHHNSSKAGGALDKYLFTFLLKKKTTNQHRWVISLIIQLQFDSNKSNKIVCSTFDLLILKCGTNPTEWEMFRKWAFNPKYSGEGSGKWWEGKFRNASAQSQRVSCRISFNNFSVSFSSLLLELWS